MDEEPKTRAADEATVLLVTITHLETRLEQLQKKIVDAGSVSGPALMLIRNELAGVQHALDRAVAAVDQATAPPKAPEPAPPGDRF